MQGLGSHRCNLQVTQADAHSFSLMARIAQVIPARSHLHSPSGARSLNYPLRNNAPRTVAPGMDERRKVCTEISFHAKSPMQCAGLNRHEAGNERVLRERSSEPLGPEF